MAPQLPSEGLQRLGSLVVPPPDFSPAAIPGVKQELRKLLGASDFADGWELRPVGLHPGNWIFGPREGGGWMLKQAPAARRHEALPTETEHCDELLRRFPALAEDPHLAFPHGVVQLLSAAKAPEHVADLLVARWVPGEQLGLFIARVDRGRETGRRKLQTVCGKVGTLLADVHKKYVDPMSGRALHHRDFHPSNVLYEERTGEINVVDCCDMGREGPRDDVERFAAVIRHWAGDEYAKAFEVSYTTAYHTAFPNVKHAVKAKAQTPEKATSNMVATWLVSLDIANCIASQSSTDSEDSDEGSESWDSVDSKSGSDSESD